jgi:hypothetical protein
MSFLNPHFGIYYKPRKGETAMDNSIKADLDTIVGEINSLIPDSQIFLFGSYAIANEGVLLNA